jgi:hypothetical protein
MITQTTVATPIPGSANPSHRYLAMHCARGLDNAAELSSQESRHGEAQTASRLSKDVRLLVHASEGGPGAVSQVIYTKSIFSLHP